MLWCGGSVGRVRHPDMCGVTGVQGTALYEEERRTTPPHDENFTFPLFGDKFKIVLEYGSLKKLRYYYSHFVGR